MATRSLTTCRTTRWVLAIWAWCAAQTAHAAPDVKFLFPAGGQRGTTVEVTAEGDFPQWPVRAWVNQTGISVTCQDKKGKLSLAIAEDAAPGLVWLRLYDESGAAAPKPFVVGILQEIAEAEPNNSVDHSQSTTGESAEAHSLTINGQLSPQGDVDVYAIPANQGQILVADLDAHRPLKSPVDAAMQIVSPEGFVLAQNDDQHSLDPRVAVTIPRDGIWQIRLFGFPATPTSRIRFAGDPSFVYRLTLSTGPWVEYTLPLAAHRGKATRLDLHGWNLPKDQRQIELGPATREQAELPIVHGDLVSAVRLPVVSHSVIVESEPNVADEAMKVSLPVVITGRIGDATDQDEFRFEGRKNHIFAAHLESRSLGFPLDAVLELRDADGKRLDRVDDVGNSRDAELTHRLQNDGQLRLAVSDLHGHGGSNFVYRLSMHWAQPDYSLAVKEHQVVVEAGGEFELPVSIERIHGHDRPIAVVAQGLPDGVQASTIPATVDTDAKEIKLRFTAADDAVATSGPIRIVGTSESVQRDASIGGADDNATPVDLWLTIARPQP